MISAIIDKSGKMDPNVILDIHRQIQTILQSRHQIHFGHYIVRTINVIQSIDRKTTLTELLSPDAAVAAAEELKTEDIIGYIGIAQEYLDIDLVQCQQAACGYCKERMDFVLFEGECTCENCGYVNDNRLENIRDDISVSGGRTYYSLKQNLLKAIERYEGKGVCVSDKDLEIIRSELERRDQLNLTKREHVQRVVKDLRMTQYYDCNNILMYLLTGKPCPNIQQYVPRILQLHGELEYVYKFVKCGSRVNSLNVNFKLYKLLRLLDVPCSLSDFCTLKTDQKYKEHEEKWVQICKFTGWELKA